MSCAIAVDAMGGDHAPAEVVSGSVRAAREHSDLQLFLVGLEEPVRGELERQGWDGDNIVVVPAESVIEMGDSPVVALRKKRNSSVAEAVNLVRAGKAQAFVSAGNTGACVAASQLALGLLPKVKKPGILVTLLAGVDPVCVLDVGANVAPKPVHLAQYGIMGSLFASEIVGVEEPRVGLLNIGGEDGKGNRLVKATRLLFEESQLNFRGYVEGDEIFRGASDVIICDGFTGNAVLKVSEGLAEQLLSVFHQVLHSSLQGAGVGVSAGGGAASPNRLEESEAGQVLRESFANLRKRLDYSEYGGAPLLGVNGVVIIAHGRSDARAIFNAVNVAKKMVDCEIIGHITERL